jgi:hypothetical protein
MIDEKGRLARLCKRAGCDCSEDEMKPYEYFCKGCGQIRLCLDEKLVGCGNCGSMLLITGEPGALDKDKLKLEFNND